LAQIRHPDVVQPLIEALHDTTLRSTAEVVRALGNLGATEAAGPLVRCMEERSDCPYDAVGEALWKLGSDRAVDAWIAGLRRAPWWLPRATCAAELGRHGGDRAVEPLHEALTDTSAEVRRAVVLALMDIRSERSVDALQRAREDADMEVRIYAAEALRRYSPR
jgi:HEAT repeat protein